MMNDIRDSWRRFYRNARKDGIRDRLTSGGPPWSLGQLIAERARLAERMPAVIEDGHYGVVVRGMDCDCTRFHWESVKTFRGIVDVWRFVELQYREAEGPLSVVFAKPSEVQDGWHESRDLALEAFEDGHPHCVFY
jgi:hypothetical protein